MRANDNERKGKESCREHSHSTLPQTDQETALRNYIQKGAAGEHPHSTPVPMTLRTQETAPERPCSMSHTGSEEGEPLSLAPAWKLERFPDTRIAERLSRCNRNACALP